MADQYQEFTTPGADSWTVPPVVNSYSVYLLGAGGGGGNSGNGAGGGGGGYAQIIDSATSPGSNYSLTIGTGGAGDGNAGGDTSWNGGNTLAGGGTGGSGTTPGTGGTPSGTYDTGYNGGSGGYGNSCCGSQCNDCQSVCDDPPDCTSSHDSCNDSQDCGCQDYAGGGGASGSSGGTGGDGGSANCCPSPSNCGDSQFCCTSGDAGAGGAVNGPGWDTDGGGSNGAYGDNDGSTPGAGAGGNSRTGGNGAIKVTFTIGHLTVGQQPSNVSSGGSISPAVSVEARFADGTLDTSFTGSVEVTLGSNPGGGTLTGTLTVSAVAGVATFSDLSIDSAGVGYTLYFSSYLLYAITSDAFNVTSSNKTINVSDGVSVAPTPTVRRLNFASVADACSLVDAPTVRLTNFASKSEAVGVVDSASVSIGGGATTLAVSVSEAISLAESVTITRAQLLGPMLPGTSAVVNTGGSSWSGFPQVIFENGSYATSDIPAGSSSNELDGYAYNLSVPNTDILVGNAQIVGVEIWVKSFDTSGALRDSKVQLRVTGATGVGNNKANNAALPSSLGFTKYGGPNDTWGLSLVGYDFHDGNFGSILAFSNPSGGTQTVSVDTWRTYIYYIQGDTHWIKPNEQISIVESVTVQLSAASPPQISPSEAVTINEVVSVVVSNPGVSKSDTATISESVNLLVSVTPSATQAVGVVDSANVNVVSLISPSQAVSVADVPTVTVQGGFQPALVDSISVADSPTVFVAEALPLNVSVTQAVGVAAIANAAIALNVFVQDSLAIVADTAHVDTTLWISARDGVQHTECVAWRTSEILVPAQVQSVGVADSCKVLIVLSVRATDSLSVASSVSAKNHLSLAVSQAVLCGENVQTAGSLRVAVSDNVNAGEAKTVNRVSFAAKTENLNVLDAATVRIPLSIQRSEQVGVASASVNVNKLLHINKTEQLHVTTSAQVARALFVTVVEAITTQDSPNTAKALQIGKSETITTSTSVSAERHMVTVGPYHAQSGGSHSAGAEAGAGHSPGAEQGASVSAA